MKHTIIFLPSIPTPLKRRKFTLTGVHGIDKSFDSYILQFLSRPCKSFGIELLFSSFNSVYAKLKLELVEYLSYYI